ncbi:MAG: carbohydrate ABC transporter substrate-binding protein, partial [Alphaproteobacteria bacterium]
MYRRATGIAIAWHARSLQEFADASIAQLAKRYDLIVLDHPHVGQVAKNRCLWPLPAPQDIDESSMGGSVESYYFAGNYWAYAIDGACQMAVCRPDIATDLPQHWEDFLAAEAKRYRALTPLKPVDAFDTLLTLVASQGAAIPQSPERFIAGPA